MKDALNSPVPDFSCGRRRSHVERWAEEEEADVRKHYFEGTFVVGKGLVVE